MQSQVGLGGDFVLMSPFLVGRRNSRQVFTTQFDGVKIALRWLVWRGNEIEFFSLRVEPDNFKHIVVALGDFALLARCQV